MKRIIAFSKFNYMGLLLSVVVTLSLISITFYRGGFNLGIDFRSGQNIKAAIPSADNVVQIVDVLKDDFPKAVVTQIGQDFEKVFSVKIPSTTENQREKLRIFEKTLDDNFSGSEILGTSFIGATLSQDLFTSAIIFTLLALLLILLYISLRFKWKFSFATIVALIHDTIFVLGIIGALQIEVTVSTVAALLTIIGYSLNDTIVIFDRIRESIGLMKGASFREITDKGITSTLSRTIITSITTMLAVLAIFFFARGDIQNFAKILLFGLVEGVWSSIFIATPMLYVFGVQKSFRADAAYNTKAELSADGSVDAHSDTIIGYDNDAKKEIGQSSMNVKEIDKVRSEILAMKSKKQRKKHKK